MSTLPTPDTASSKIRMGYEAQYGVPAAVAVMDYEPPFQSTDADPEKGVVEITNIAGTGHQPEPLPGKAIVQGVLTAQNDADGQLALIANALSKSSSTSTLETGVYRTTYGRSQGTAVPSVTIEKDRDDGVRDLTVGAECTEMAITVANNAAMIVNTTINAAYATVWSTPAERHPNPATGSLYIRGLPPEWIDRENGDAGDLYLRLVDLYTDAQNRTWAVFMARVGAPKAITGTWTVTAGTKAFSGSGGAALTDLVSGDIIDVETERLTVDVVTDDQTFTTLENHVAGAAAKNVVREYGRAADAGLSFFEVRPGLSSQTTLPRWWPAKNSSGGYMGSRAQAGSTVEVHMTSSAGIVAGTLGALTGTVSVTATDATVTGVGTAFLSELEVGAYIITAGGQAKRVLSIASNTSLEADSNYDTSEAAVAMSAREIPQVSLTGTVSTAATTALTGVGTAFTTELSAGGWVRTAGGEWNRILTITNDTTATMVRAWTGTEPGVAATTDYEWSVARERADWAAATHASGLFPELLSEAHLWLSTTNVAEERVEIAESIAITYVAGKVGVGGLGSEHQAGVFTSGFSTGTATVTARNVSSQLRKAILGQERLRGRLVCSTGRLVGASVDREYTWTWVFHMKPTGKPVTIPDATTNQQVLTGALFPYAADPDGYTDALQLVVDSDRATPLATS